MKVIHCPSGESWWSRIGCVAFRIGIAGPLVVSVFGSKATLTSDERQSRLAYASFVPSREKLISPLQLDGVVIGSGLPCTRPVFSSIATRHRFIVPPRLLEK